MKKLLTLLTAALLSTAVDVGAAQPDLGSLWGLPCGQLEQEFQEASQRNRMLNLAAASGLVRVGFQIRGPVFDPDDTNVLLECHTNRQVLELADEYGLRLDVVSLLHIQGDPNGWNYHCARRNDCGPILDKFIIRSWWVSFIELLDSDFPQLKVLGGNGKGIQYATIANELAYCPSNDCPSPSDLADIYKEIIDFATPVWPSRWIKVDGGLLGALEVSPAWVNSRDIAVSLHCNGHSNRDCKNQLQALAAVYNKVIIDEDRPPQQGHNHAPQRYAICADVPECIGYLTFYGRRSGNPPESTCCWKVGGCSNGGREHIGVESCGGAWNDGNDGLFRRGIRGVGRLFAQPFRGRELNEVTGEMERMTSSRLAAGGFINYQKFNEAAVNAGTAVPGWDFDLLPNTFEEGQSTIPVGMHQWCSGFTRWGKMWKVQAGALWPEGLLVPNPAACKDDDGLVATYAGWLGRVGLP